MKKNIGLLSKSAFESKFDDFSIGSRPLTSTYPEAIGDLGRLDPIEKARVLIEMGFRKKSVLQTICLVLFTSFLFFITTDAQATQQNDTDLRPKNSCCLDPMYFYAKALGGANFLQSTAIEGNRASYQTGYIFAGSLGYCYRYGLCLEAEYSFRRNGISKIDFFGEGSSKHGYFQTSSYMGNLVWGLPSWGCAFWKIQPFFGGGVGYDFQQMRSSNSRIVFHQTWNHFSWQLMAGLAYPIFRHTELSLEYKFHQGGSHFNNNSIGVGLVYKFGYIRY